MINLHETLAIAGGKFMENKFNKKWNLDQILPLIPKFL